MLLFSALFFCGKLSLKVIKYFQQLSLLDSRAKQSPKAIAAILVALVMSIDFCFANMKLMLNHSLATYITLWYPQLLKACLVGLRDKGSRYQSASSELTYVCQQVFFSSFETAYFAAFMPLKLIAQDRTLYYDQLQVLAFAAFAFWVQGSFMFMHSLFKRAQEMEYNVRMTGKWVEAKEESESKTLPWMQNVSYA